MTDYISRAELYAAFCKASAPAFDNHGKATFIVDYVKVLETIPVADVRPVEWIPVTERLPDTGVDVLVKFPHNMAVASIDIGEWVVNSGDGWCTDINLAGGEKNPTHWMPLPEPPTAEEGE